LVFIKSSMLKAGESQAHCSALKIVLTCYRNICDLKAFLSGRITHYTKSTCFRWNGKTHVSYGQYNLCSMLKYLAHDFPMRIQFPFEWNTASISGISNVRYQIHPFKWMEVALCICKKIINATSRKVYNNVNCEIWPSLLKEYLRYGSVLKWENHSFYENYLLQRKCTHTCVIWNNTIY
jgi:hypothetical protein